MEPQWTKQISNNSVCTTYYVIFFIYAVLAGITLLGTIAIVLSFKLPKGMGVGFGFYGVIMSILLTVLALFQYLVCSRALLGEQKVKLTKEGFFSDSNKMLDGM
jgi:hypothetical protein